MRIEAFFEFPEPLAEEKLVRFRPGGEIWKIEDAVYPLICLCEKLLSDNPLFFLINSYTTGLAPAVLTYMLSLAVKSRHGGTVEASEIGLPVTQSGLVLPCGASGRWSV